MQRTFRAHREEQKKKKIIKTDFVGRSLILNIKNILNILGLNCGLKNNFKNIWEMFFFYKIKYNPSNTQKNNKLKRKTTTK